MMKKILFMEVILFTSFQPCFILLDREGKIIASHMSRPSEPETVKTLDALLGR